VTSDTLKKAHKADFTIKRPRGRPPKQWTDHIRQDTNLPILTTERLSKDRIKWKKAVKKNVSRLSSTLISKK